MEYVYLHPFSIPCPKLLSKEKLSAGRVKKSKDVGDCAYLKQIMFKYVIPFRKLK